jgi:fused signal recognition particle receptor
MFSFLKRKKSSPAVAPEPGPATRQEADTASQRASPAAALPMPAQAPQAPAAAPYAPPQAAPAALPGAADRPADRALPSSSPLPAAPQTKTPAAGPADSAAAPRRTDIPAAPDSRTGSITAAGSDYPAAIPDSAPGAPFMASPEASALLEMVARPDPDEQGGSGSAELGRSGSQTPGLPSAAPAKAPEGRASWLSRLKSGLSRTGQSIGGLFVGVKVDEALFEELESALIMADAGVEATERLLTALRARVRKDRLTEAGQVRAALRDILTDHLTPLEKPFPLGKTAPLVIMMAGVNGAGKTTSIGKLANTFQRQGASVLLAAGDTFRAAAREQLVAWGTRNNVTVISQEGGDPAAVAFDAVNAGRARQAGVVMIDTAGRLSTQLHLMEELKKIKRVIGKADSAAPHEILLVIDGNTGQNAIAQIRAFDAAVTLTGLVVTKLDGTAKGGTLAAVAAGSQGVRPVPVYWIGVGEGLDDLQPFVAREFATALVGGD